MKLEIPKFRYITQGEDGRVVAWSKSPYYHSSFNYWSPKGGISAYIYEGQPTPNWRDTLIDLEVDDYDFSDGILRRVGK